MTVLAGCGVKESGASSLALAAMLARSSGQDVLVAVVVPAPWPPVPERVDAEYRGYLTRRGEETLEQARRRMPDDVSATFVLHPAASVPAGPLELGRHHEVSAPVLGSAESGGLGHVALGSIAQRVVHGCDVPVAFAPDGFRPAPLARVGRVTAAFGGVAHDRDVVVAAARYAAATSAAFRIASFSCGPGWSSPRRWPARGGPRRRPVAACTRQVLSEQLDEVRTLPDVPAPLEVLIGDGHDWREAIGHGDWSEDDLLVIGSGSSGPLASVYLGARASKILRNTPAPVVLLPGPGSRPGTRVTRLRAAGVQITPSILNPDFADLGAEVARIGNADWVHVDIMDNHFVPNLTFGPAMVEALARSTDVPLDAT